MEVHVSPVSTRQNAPRQLKSCDVTGGGAARALRATRAGGGARARRIPRYDGFDNAKIKKHPHHPSLKSRATLLDTSREVLARPSPIAR